MESSLNKRLLVCLCLFSVVVFLHTVGSNVFLGISTLLFLITVFKNKTVTVADDNKRYFKVISVFAMALFVSNVFSGHIGVGLKIWSNFFLWRFMPFVIILSVFANKNKAEKILYAAFGGFLIDCIYAIYQGAFVYKFNIAYGRAAGFVGHPMTLAGFACILLPVLLIFAFRRDISKKFQLFCAFLFVIGCCALIFNSTRGAWVALAIVLPLISIPFVLNSRNAFVIFMAVILVIGLAVSGSSSFMKRINSITDIEKNWSNASRLIIWDTAYGIFREHPFLGVGLGQFRPVYKSKFIVTEEMKKGVDEYQIYVKNKKAGKLTVEQKNFSMEKVNELADNNRKVWQYKHLGSLGHAHNNIMQMLGENGLVGGLGYICAFGYILWSGLRNYILNQNPYSLMIFSSTFALFLQGLTEYNFGNGAVMKVYWLVLACLIVLASSFDNEKVNDIV